MNIARRTLTFMSGFLKSYGPSNIKKILWDKEFSGGKWDFIDNTADDCVYPHLHQYLHNGSILDLGCGPGNTANELAAGAYQFYLGVDISEAALDKARRRTHENGRVGKNVFLLGDFLTYVPTQQFDVILFRESMYHVPLGKVGTILDRYSKYLKDSGVFVVRIAAGNDGKTKYRPKAMINTIESGFNVVEKSQHVESGATILVFRPRRPC